MSSFFFLPVMLAQFVRGAFVKKKRSDEPAAPHRSALFNLLCERFPGIDGKYYNAKIDTLLQYFLDSKTMLHTNELSEELDALICNDEQILAARDLPADAFDALLAERALDIVLRTSLPREKNYINDYLLQPGDRLMIKIVSFALTDMSRACGGQKTFLVAYDLNTHEMLKVTHNSQTNKGSCFVGEAPPHQLLKDLTRFRTCFPDQAHALR